MEKTNYTTPSISIESVEVEQGFAASIYGKEGEAGQQSGYIDYGDSEEDYL